VTEEERKDEGGAEPAEDLLAPVEDQGEVGGGATKCVFPTSGVGEFCRETVVCTLQTAAIVTRDM
jgi:hypothetical protein